ncbi:MAG: Tn3 family transposase, partial [Verrucomicrobia bacterium]|nr:Tn3 family transposase [Verrucomicrobiota bacterium]
MAWRWRTFLWDFTYLCWNLTNDEKYRRRMGRELNNGEPAHDLSRFLCFGKEGVLRGREFGDQVHTFSCLSVLHNAVVAWNILHIESIVNQLRV